MEQLELIIKQGTKDNDATIVPTVNERLSLKVSIFDILSQLDKSIYVMNKKLFAWKKRLVSGEITLPESVEQMKNGEFNEKLADWLLDPILVFCENTDEVSKKISDGLYEKGYHYVRARHDIYPSRINIDVEFEIGAIVNPTNKSLSKHTELIDLYGANVNFNGFLMIPIFLYEYITPKFNYEEWEGNLELEPFLWRDLQDKWEKKGVTKPAFNSINSSEKVFNILKNEQEGTYLFTGYYSYFLMTAQEGEYKGDYHVYHENPLELMKKINAEIPGLKLKEETPIYYFQNNFYQLYLNGEIILTIYSLPYPMNYIRLGYYNHTNYHGLLLFLSLEALRVSMREYDDKVSNIGYLVKYRNMYLKNPHEKNVFEILQNNSVGPRTNPFLEFKKKEWKRDLPPVYRPDVKEIKEESDEQEDDSEKNEKKEN